MRRKPEFPTKEAWLARRGLGHSSASPDASPGSDEQASPGSEPEPGSPVHRLGTVPNFEVQRRRAARAFADCADPRAALDVFAHGHVDGAEITAQREVSVAMVDDHGFADGYFSLSGDLGSARSIRRHGR